MGNDSNLNSKKFASLVSQGNIKATLRIIDEDKELDINTPIHFADLSSSSLLVHDILKEKHPPVQPAHMESLTNTSNTSIFCSV